MQSQKAENEWGFLFRQGSQKKASPAERASRCTINDKFITFVLSRMSASWVTLPMPRRNLNEEIKQEVMSRRWRRIFQGGELSNSVQRLSKHSLNTNHVISASKLTDRKHQLPQGVLGYKGSNGEWRRDTWKKMPFEQRHRTMHRPRERTFQTKKRADAKLERQKHEHS